MTFRDLLYYADIGICAMSGLADVQIKDSEIADLYKKHLAEIKRISEKIANLDHPVFPIDGYDASEQLTVLYKNAKGSARQAYSAAIDLISGMPDITEVDEE